VRALKTVAETRNAINCLPQTWLLSEGWKRGAPISVYAVPAPPS
jgi:hypothetical protein